MTALTTSGRSDGIVRRLRFCGFVEPVRATVENGVIVSRTIVATGEPVPASLAEGYPDVRGLFAIVEEAARDANELEMEFDPSYGLPTLISIDWAASYVDDEIVYRTESLTIPP